MPRNLPFPPRPPLLTPRPVVQLLALIALATILLVMAMLQVATILRLGFDLTLIRLLGLSPKISDLFKNTRAGF